MYLLFHCLNFTRRGNLNVSASTLLKTDGFSCFVCKICIYFFLAFRQYVFLVWHDFKLCSRCLT